MRIKDTIRTWKKTCDGGVLQRLCCFVLFMLILFVSPVCSASSVSSITILDWNELRIDSLLPCYTEVVPLETDYRMYDYRVEITYPEWAPLSADEVRRVEQTGIPVGEELEVAASVSVSRKRGMLDIAFCPIVKRDGRYQKLLSASIDIVPTPKARNIRRAPQATASERYVRQSVLAEGKWVKIAITADGMYRLTRSALKKMGFSNPDNVRLYGHGGYRLSEISAPDEEYDDLQEVPLYKADDDTWLFWGNGLVYWSGNTRVINPYATQACYFLTQGDSPSQMATAEKLDSCDVSYDTFTDHVLYEKDEYAWFHGGRNLYDPVNYANSSSHTYKLTTHNSQGDERLTVVFTASSDESTELKTTVNGNALAATTLSALGSYQAATSASRTTDVSSYRVGDDWTVNLSSTSGHDARLDYLTLHYTRQITPHEGYVAFSASQSGTARFDVSGSGLQVMRIGEPGDTACLISGTQQGNTYQVVVDDASRRYVAFNPQYDFPQPAVVGTIENQNLHALDSLDMVIIVPANDKLTSQANRLAEAHRQTDGLRVCVVRADQVYNEFSSGTPDATAYRRLMKMLYDRAQTDDQMPRYLLLFGDCAWDNRMLSSG